MKQHTRILAPVPSPVLETHAPSLQLDPRERLAAAAALGLGRCPAALVARATGRSLATVHGWRQPGMVGGLRALDLMLAPRPFGRTVVRYLCAGFDGGGPPDGPSRSSLAAVLARVAGLLLVVSQEDPSKLSDETLRDRIRTLDETEEAIRRERQRYDLEALRRQLAARKGVE